MSELNPCTSCGACCAYFRVSFYWGECASAGGLVPDELTVQVSPSMAAMIGTDRKPSRCVSLHGELGKQVGCTMYEKRSSTCREFEASWVGGIHNPDCDKARAAHGLAPLSPPAIALIELPPVLQPMAELQLLETPLGQLPLPELAFALVVDPSQGDNTLQ